mgnify:CR=1 FL=1
MSGGVWYVLTMYNLARAVSGMEQGWGTMSENVGQWRAMLGDVGECEELPIGRQAGPTMTWLLSIEGDLAPGVEY